ncbi:hypothetical protein [Flavobacterium sp. TBRC 19031]|uniref:hypothetical protein n=1 Tax=Flavobacterium mekongense TaxID=3379707 RepID=UPI00399A2AA7
MTPEQKAYFVDKFLYGLLHESSFPSSFASVLELSELPSEQNRDNFKILEYDVERLGLVEFIRGRDNSTLDGQCEYFISAKGADYVSSGTSTLKLFQKQEQKPMNKFSWSKAYGRLFKIINGPAYMTGSEFLNVAREINEDLPLSYTKYIDNRRDEGKSTSRQEYYWDIIDEMTEEQKHEFFQAMIKILTPRVPQEIGLLTELFDTEENAVIVKKAVPSKDMPEAMYLDVLETLHSTYRSAEQKPSLYQGKGEEDLRDLGLMMLESRYKGAVAAGEAFNKLGKTDIVLKSDDGSNLFVAECKVWRGAGQVQAAIDQLFGYLTWRDTKSTLIFFVPNADFSTVLGRINEEVEKHPLFVRHVGDRNESSFSYIFRHPEDANREVKIEVMAFSFPT